MIGRKWFSLTLILMNLLVFGQEKKMKKMPVLFGCEKFSSNEEIKKCFNETIGTAIGNEIDFFSNIADYLHIPSEQAKLKFTISTDGEFINLGADGSNPIFNSFAMSSVVLIQNKLKRLDLKVQPGLDQKNQPMDVSMSIPVRYQSIVDKKVYDDFPSNNRVLFTIDFEDEIIEVRMDKNYVITTYGNNGEREFYLGKYNNLFELAVVEPYATKINDAYQSSLTFITKGIIEDKEYKIQMKNFFSNNPNESLLIEVIREENGSWAEYYSFKTKEEFNQSKFAKLTYR